MNPSKKNHNGWILCPSKSFPGQFYYFNVANGETAWSLNETEKQFIKNPTIQKIDKSHCYPEPNSPPVEKTPPSISKPSAQPNLYPRKIENNVYKDVRTNNTYSKDNSSNNYSSRNISTNISTFVIQPTRFDQDYRTPATPIQIQVPMILGSNFQNNAPQVILVLMNQSAPSNQLAIEEPKHVSAQLETEPDRELFIQTGKTPLYQRFVNFEEPVADFKNNIIQKPPCKLSGTSTPNKSVLPIFPHDQSVINSLGPSKNQTNGNDIRNLPKTTLQKNPYNSNVFVPSSCTNFNPKVEQSNKSHTFNRPLPVLEENSNRDIFKLSSIDTNPFKNVVNQNPTSKYSAKVDIPTNTNTNLEEPSLTKEKSTLNQGNKVEMTSNDADLLNLDENDLRRILMAKKRKATDLENAKTVEGKKIRTSKQENFTVAPSKKKVTFNLVPEHISDMSTENLSYGEEDGAYDETEQEGTGMQESHLSSPKSSDSWYVVVDTAALLEELQFLDSFVKLDPNCHLLIPSRVMSDTIALSQGNCPERHLVTLARHSLRQLATPQPHIIVQPSQFEDDMPHVTTSDSILNCCLEVMEQNAHVVLITNDENLRAKAESFQILCSDPEQIKDSFDHETDVHFDAKKIKICITNVPENMQTNTYKNTYDSVDKGSSTNCINFPFSNDVYEASKPEWNHNTITTDLPVLNERNQIQEYTALDATQVVPTIPKKSVNFQNLKPVSFYFQNKKSNLENQSEIVEETINAKNQPQTVSFYFQNNQNKEEQRNSSVFKLANDKIKKYDTRYKTIFETENEQTSKVRSKSSIFEIDGIEKIKTGQMKPNFRSNDKTTPIFENKQVLIKKSILESDYFPTKDIPKKSNVFENEKHKNERVQLRPSIFENEKCENREARSFEMDEKYQPVLPYEINNGDLEDYVKRFFLKNRIEDNMLEQKQQEIMCSLKQVLEECLTNVLKVSSSVHRTSPPWAFHEALQCMVKVYGDHARVRAAVSVLSVLNAKAEVRASALVKIIAGAFTLVRYLKNITTDSEALPEAENSLNGILHSIVEQNTNLDIEQYKTPIFSRCDELRDDPKYRKNFVKDRSETVNYLKKHFPAWADYDETLEKTKSEMAWGQNYKDVKIVRTFGKNLNLLKINKCKTITVNQPPGPSNNFEDNTKEPSNKETNVKENGTRHINKEDNNNKTTVKINENISTTPWNVENTAKNVKDTEFRITRVVENKPRDIIEQRKVEEANHKFDAENTNFGEPNVKQALPKVIRIFNDIKLTKENKGAKVDTEKSICNLDYTRGHTFGTENNNGPKVVRNIQLIKEFEEKLKRKPLDLDELDYSGVSKSDDGSLINRREADDYLSINEKMYIDTNTNDANRKDQINHLDATNDYKENSKYDTQNRESSVNGNTSQATNNESYSMSLDNCVANDVYATNDFKNENYAKNDNCFSSDYVSFLTNVASDGTNDFCANKNYNSYAVNDEYTKAVQKDDTTNDSGYENESIQAYSIVKSFLYELNGSFKLIHKFITGNMQQCRDGTLLGSKRRALHLKASATHAQIVKIIDKLKRIIKRESSDGTTLKLLLAGSGTRVTSDGHVSNYRQVVTQCLKQARTLGRALRLMLSITVGSTD